MSLYKEIEITIPPISTNRGLYESSRDTWTIIGERVEQLDKLCVLPEHVFPDGVLKEWFHDGDNSIVLLFDNDMLIGYAVARPVSNIWPDTRFQDSDTCNLSTIVIDPKFQGNGFVKLIMDLMEEVLGNRGYKFLEMNAAVENGYANATERHYGDRIEIMGNNRETSFGTQRFFRINLNA